LHYTAANECGDTFGDVIGAIQIGKDKNPSRENEIEQGASTTAIMNFVTVRNSSNLGLADVSEATRVVRFQADSTAKPLQERSKRNF
jgi:hypothetical protein